MDVMSKMKLQGTYQDEDHTDRHYIALFAEQLTRTFEVLVHTYSLFQVCLWLEQDIMELKMAKLVS